MVLALMLLLQAGATAAPARIDFDLARYRPGADAAPVCRGGAGGPEEVVVCGPRRRGGGAYPLAEMARLFAARPIVAETGIAGNLRGDVHVESAAMDRGAVSQRVMMRLRLPF